jgi:hypothetical protein
VTEKDDLKIKDEYRDVQNLFFLEGVDILA